MMKMKKRVSVRAIIFHQGSLMTLFRRKVSEGKIEEYYSLPGGGVEENETLEETIIREVKEEFSVEIKVLDYLGMVEEEKAIEHFFYCEIVRGAPILGGEEKEESCYENYYEIRPLPLEDIASARIRFRDKIEIAKKKKYRKEL